MPSTRARDVVLLVQPRDQGLHTYATCLADQGLAVIAVSDTWEALLAAPKADVVVTDLLLAGSMDGVGLIRRLRHYERAERKPIIVLTACAWDAERQRAKDAGCDMFLVKPCVPSEVLRHVCASIAHAALRARPGGPVPAVAPRLARAQPVEQMPSGVINEIDSTTARPRSEPVAGQHHARVAR